MSTLSASSVHFLGLHWAPWVLAISELRMERFALAGSPVRCTTGCGLCTPAPVLFLSVGFLSFLSLSVWWV